MAPKVSEAHLAERRQHIIAAARRCFARQGFHQTSMQHVCAEAGVSPGALYRYFAGKDELVRAICEGELLETESLVSELSQGATDTVSLLDGLLALFFEQAEGAEWEEKRRIFPQLWAEALHNEDARQLLENALGTEVEMFAVFVRLAQERGDIDGALDPLAVARVMLAVYEGHVVQRLLDPEFDVRSYAEVLRGLFTGGFWTGGAAAPRSSQRKDTAR